MAESKGVWLDKESGKVVTKQPSRGRQIVAPGKEMTPQLEASVELYTANAQTIADDDTEAITARPVETVTTTAAPAKKAAKSTSATKKK